MKKLFKISYLFLFCAVLCSCSNNVAQEQTKSISLNLTIFDELGNVVQGASVYLLASASDFDQSTALQAAVNPLEEVISDGNGKVNLQIEKDKNYYFYIIKNTGGVIRTNVENNISSLPKNLNISINIRLKPINGSIKFISTNSDITTNNLKVSILGISTSMNSVLVINSTTGNIFVSRYGKYKYQSTDGEGCSWTGFFEIFRGEATANDEILEKCSIGKVNFITSNIPTYLPLNISIDGVSFGQISTNVNSNISLTLGSHTYFAKSVNSTTNSCVWTSTFEITEDSILDVVLPTCR